MRGAEQAITRRYERPRSDGRLDTARGRPRIALFLLSAKQCPGQTARVCSFTSPRECHIVRGYSTSEGYVKACTGAVVEGAALEVAF